MNLLEKNPNAAPFLIEGQGERALLLHGFTGTPAEMRPIADFLAQHFGWTVMGPLLPGHGTNAQDLNQVGLFDWKNAAQKALNEIGGDQQPVHLVGLSMGALLCLDLFAKHPQQVASLGLLAPSLWLKNKIMQFFLPLVHLPFFPLLQPGVTKKKPNPDHVAYKAYPTKALRGFERFCRWGRNLPAMQSPPTFVCASKVDDVVAPRSATYLSKRLLGKKNRLLWLEKSSHILTLGPEKLVLLQGLESFYREITSPSSVR